MSYYFSHYSGIQIGLSPHGNLAIDALLVAFLVYCAISDGMHSKIPNIATFPAMLAGLVFNSVFGGLHGFVWALLGWGVGMAIQWVPYSMGLAKAGDVKLLAAVGALKGWPFCVAGFCYGAIAFGVLAVPWLAMRGELKGVGDNLKGYAELAALTQRAPDAPAPTVVKKFMPWGVGLAVGFFVALGLELTRGHPFLWMK